MPSVPTALARLRRFLPLPPSARARARLHDLAARLAAAEADRDRLEAVVAAVQADLAATRTDATGYRVGYEQLASEVGGLRAEAAGYRAAYRELEAVVGTARSEAAGYRAASDAVSTELSRFRSLLRAAPPTADRPRQLVFLHIQKTAGITLADFFGHQFSWERALQAHSPNEFDAYPPEEVAHFDFVCGHLTARNLAAVRPDAQLCTVLREPADRVLSCYWYFRNYTGAGRDSIRDAVAAAKRQSLIEFVHNPDPAVRRHVRDHQAWALAADWANPDDRPPADLLAAALAGLDRFECVGVTEDLPAFAARVSALRGWPAPAALPRLNTTTGRAAVSDLTPAEREAIAEATAVDAAVYGAARARA